MISKILNTPLFFLALVLILQILDICLTTYGISRGLREGNSFYGLIQNLVKPFLLIVPYITYLFVKPFIKASEQRLFEIFFKDACLIIIIFYIIVILWNVYQIWKVV